MLNIPIDVVDKLPFSTGQEGLIGQTTDLTDGMVGQVQKYEVLVTHFLYLCIHDLPY